MASLASFRFLLPMLQGIIIPTYHLYTGTNFKLYVMGNGLHSTGLEQVDILVSKNQALKI